MKIKKIVIATDFSEEANRPFGPVAALAKKTGAQITLLHSIQTLTNTSGEGRIGTLLGPSDYEPEVKNADLALEVLAKGLGPSVSHHVVVGTSTPKGIVNYAEENDADLLAISTHGRTGMRRFVLGSVAEEVLRRSSVPVLCFPERDAKDRAGMDIKHILLTTDLSAEAMRPFAPVLELAASLGSRVSVLHVLPAVQAVPYGAIHAPLPSESEIIEEIEDAKSAVNAQCAELASDLDLHVEVIRHENASKGVVQFASENDVDLIALSSHGHTGFKRAAFGSVAEQVLRRSSVPVLSFHRVKE